MRCGNLNSKMKGWLIVIDCLAALLIAAAVAVVVASRNRRQPLPPPDVPVAELPQALREANTNGGYNDLSSCGLCDEKTKETRHGGAEKTRWRP